MFGIIKHLINQTTYVLRITLSLIAISYSFIFYNSSVIILQASINADTKTSFTDDVDNQIVAKISQKDGSLLYAIRYSDVMNALNFVVSPQKFMMMVRQNPKDATKLYKQARAYVVKQKLCAQQAREMKLGNTSEGKKEAASLEEERRIKAYIDKLSKEISDTEIYKEYEEMKTKLPKPSYLTGNIIITSKEEADGVLIALRGSADSLSQFKNMAKKHSILSSASKEGAFSGRDTDLVFSFGNEIVEEMKKLTDRSYTQSAIALKGDYNGQYALIYLDERKDLPQNTFEELKSFIKNRVLVNKINENAKRAQESIEVSVNYENMSFEPKGSNQVVAEVGKKKILCKDVMVVLKQSIHAQSWLSMKHNSRMERAKQSIDALVKRTLISILAEKEFVEDEVFKKDKSTAYDRLLAQLYINKVEKDINEDSIKRMYLKLLKDMKNPTEFSGVHILVPMKSTAEKLVREIREHKGDTVGLMKDKFAIYDENKSTNSAEFKKRDIDLYKEWGSEIVRVLLGLSEKEVSDPIEISDGKLKGKYLIIYLTNKMSVSKPSFDELKDEIKAHAAYLNLLKNLEKIKKVFNVELYDRDGNPEKENISDYKLMGRMLV